MLLPLYGAMRFQITLVGDLIYLRVFGKGVLLIGSAELAHEFLDKRSANTSDRAVSPAIKL